jgi:restriction endonuclease Mrr
MKITVKSDRDGQTLLVATVRTLDATRLASLVDDLDAVAARYLLDDDEAAEVVAH